MQAEDGKILDMSLNSHNILNKLHLLLSLFHFLLSAWYFMHLFINSKRGGGRGSAGRIEHVDQDTSSARVGQDRADVQPRARTPGGLTRRRTSEQEEKRRSVGHCQDGLTRPTDGQRDRQTDPPWIYSDSAERERERESSKCAPGGGQRSPGEVCSRVRLREFSL